MAFKWAYSLDGSDPIIQSFVVLNDAVISVGEMLNLESGEAAPAATGDTALIGIALEALDNADDGLSVKAIINPNAVYFVEDDANARVTGALLDLDTGALTVAADSSHDLMVVRDSTSTENTYVTFNGTHFTQV